jgi:hypothetical protein
LRRNKKTEKDTGGIFPPVSFKGVRMKKDFFCGIICAFFGLLFLLAIPVSIPHNDLLTQMGPRFFPSLLSGGLIVLGTILVIQSLIRKRERGGISPASLAAQYAISSKDEARAIILFFIMAASCVLFAYFRFIISMPLAVTVMLVSFKVKNWKAYGFLYAFIALLYFVFVKLMYVQL